MKGKSLTLMHIKLTDSLQRDLERCGQSASLIRLTINDDGAKIYLSVNNKNVCYDLETDHNTNYFSVATLNGPKGKFLGPITKRYRTKATDASFVKARENLVKEVEQIRQQKIEVLATHSRSAGQIKEERIEKYKRALRSIRNADEHQPSKKSRSCSLKQTFLPGRSSSKRMIDLESKLSLACTNSQPDEPTLIKSANTIKPGPIQPVESGKADEFKLTEVPIERHAYDRCVNAIHMRRDLERRLNDARTSVDQDEQDKLIQEIQDDLVSLVNELYNDSLLRQYIPVASDKKD